MGTDWDFLYNRFVRRRRKVNDFWFRWTKRGIGAISDPQEQILEQYILQQHPDRTFIDIGANVGGWSIRAARFYRSVISFEPVSRFAELLRQNMRLNNIRNISVKEFRLGNEDRLDAPSGFQARLRLDTFKFRDVGLIKIDVEGEGHDVVKGSLNTIRENRPIILVETHKKTELQIPLLLDDYRWDTPQRVVKPVPGYDAIEDGMQTFLVGSPL